ALQELLLRQRHGVPVAFLPASQAEFFPPPCQQPRHLAPLPAPSPLPEHSSPPGASSQAPEQSALSAPLPSFSQGLLVSPPRKFQELEESGTFSVESPELAGVS